MYAHFRAPVCLWLVQDKKNVKEGDRMFGVLKQAWGIDVTAVCLPFTWLHCFHSDS